MIDTLIEGGSLFLSIGGIMGGSCLMVRAVEAGKVKRVAITEHTKAVAFEAALMAEQNRQFDLQLRASAQNAELASVDPPIVNPGGIDWEVT